MLVSMLSTDLETPKSDFTNHTVTVWRTLLTLTPVSCTELLVPEKQTRWEDSDKSMILTMRIQQNLKWKSTMKSHNQPTLRTLECQPTNPRSTRTAVSPLVMLPSTPDNPRLSSWVLFLVSNTTTTPMESVSTSLLTLLASLIISNKTLWTCSLHSTFTNC